MHRKFISLVIASAIAVTGISASAAKAEGVRGRSGPSHNQRGGNEALAAGLAGLVALYAIGTVISENNRGQGHAKAAPAPRAHRHAPPRRAYGRRHGRDALPTYGQCASSNEPTPLGDVVHGVPFLATS